MEVIFLKKKENRDETLTDAQFCPRASHLCTADVQVRALRRVLEAKGAAHIEHSFMCHKILVSKYGIATSVYEVVIRPSDSSVHGVM